MTYDYHYYAKLAWDVDGVLLVSSLALSVLIVFYVIIKEYLWNRRSRALLKIKSHVYEMILSGQKGQKDQLARLAAETTPGQFLDITTNRNRELIFFNDSEQAIFKQYFISPEKVAYVKRVASRAPNKWRRIEAIMTLGHAGIHDAIDIIEKSLFNKDEDISYFSMISLGQLKDIKAGGALIKFLKHKPLNGHKIISILEAFPEEIVDDAVGLLEDRNPQVRIWALRLIEKFRARARRHIEIVKGLTNDDIAEARAAACECLGKIGNKDDKALLIAQLKNDSWLVRSSAVKALSDLLGQECIPIVSDMIKDPSLSVIETVKEAILTYIDAALPYLEKFLYEGDALAKRLSVEVLEESGQLADLFDILLSDDGSRKPQALRLLKGVIESGARSGLDGIISRFDSASREKILKIIKDIGE